MTAWDAVGYLAAALVFAAFGMKKMIRLRIVALCSNIAFIAYGVGLDLPPVLLLHAGLLPLNGWRLWQALGSVPAPRAPKVASPLFDIVRHDQRLPRREPRKREATRQYKTDRGETNACSDASHTSPALQPEHLRSPDCSSNDARDQNLDAPRPTIQPPTFAGGRQQRGHSRASQWRLAL
jgi:hypothetical protein